MFGLGKSHSQPVSDDLRTYLERVTIMEARITALELDASAFRDKVLRKIQYRADDAVAAQPRKPGQRVRS